MTRGEKAEALFLSGYNCPQSVVLAFADKLPLDEKAAAMLVSGLGGGVCRMREICGAASGMVLVLGRSGGIPTPRTTPARPPCTPKGSGSSKPLPKKTARGALSAPISSASPGRRNRRSRRRGPKGIIRRAPARRSCGRLPRCWPPISAKQNKQTFSGNSRPGCANGRIFQMRKKPLTSRAGNVIILSPLVPGS